MQYGVCVGLNEWEQAAEAGAEYVECAAVSLNALTDRELQAFSNQLEQRGLQCEALNILFPGELRLTGDTVDMEIIGEYADKILSRLSILSPEIVVFGSGGSRRYPPDFEPAKAYEQIAAVCLLLAETAARYHIVIALEALNRKETNLINTLEEAHALVKRVNHPHLKLVADFYHMLAENEPVEMITACGDALAHVHIAVKTTRACPALTDRPMFTDYFNALGDIRYNKRISIEGRIDDYPRQIPEAFTLFRSYD